MRKKAIFRRGLSKGASLAASAHSPAIEHYNRGVMHQQQGNFDLAIEKYTEAIALDAQLALAYYNRGNAYGANYFRKAANDQAISDYDQAIALDPQNVDAYCDRGNVHADSGDYDRAIADYDQAIALRREYIDAYNGRGLAHYLKGDYDRAIADLERTLELFLDPRARQDTEQLLEEWRQEKHREQIE